MPEFRENLLGRLSNFPLSVEKPLMPVFEAISNAIHAIEDSKRTDGQIIVRVHRKQPETEPVTKDAKAAEMVEGFTIEDNGIGFNERNFLSFCEADTTFKKARGGKGVGRLSWLKVFDWAEVESVFADTQGKKQRRKFTFTLDRTPIQSHSLEETEDVSTGAIVRLGGFNALYQHNCPKKYETLARHLVEHFLTQLVLDTCPRITLSDPDQESDESLNTIFHREIGKHGAVDEFTVAGHRFKVQHFRIGTRSSAANHQLHFCALARSVESRDLAKILPNLDGALFDDDTGAFGYSGYISGKLLDECVNQERTRLELLHDDSLFVDQDEPARERLIKEVAAKAATFLEPYLGPIKAKKLARITEYAQKRIPYRPIVKLRPEWLDEIRADVTSEDDLEFELLRLRQRLDLEVRKSGTQLTNRAAKTAESLADHKKKFEKFLEESNVVGHSMLAEYVVHRRAVIDFLVQCMKVTEDGRYPLEEVVHDVIFPMKATSSDIRDPDQSNLWMIDERLAYHYYLASDMEFRQTGEIKVEKKYEKKRTDLLVLQPYNLPHAFVGTNQKPFDAVTIIEFKRPNRDDYSERDDEHDPIAQVWRYAQRIQAGEVKDKSGQFIKTGDGTHYYGYVIANLTPKMRDLAEFHNFTPMPDNLGYFHWQQKYRVYCEVLDYDKIIQDAKKRNEVFFDKFSLPPMT